MADVRGAAGAPSLANFGGSSSPTPSTPLYVNLTTGDLWVNIAEVPVKVGSQAAGTLPTLGTGVATALAIAVGNPGAFITFNGDAGTPSALVGTNISGTAASLIAGKATILATARAIYGNNFDGSSALTQVIASTYGGTGNGFTKFSGPTTAEKTFTLPNANATIARTDAGQTFTGVQAMTSPDITTSITTTSTSFTAFAGATTLLTIGGTGASASLFAPSTLDATSSITGAIRTSGGMSAAKAANFGTTLTVGGTSTFNDSVNVATGKLYKLNSVAMVSAQTAISNYWFANSGNLTATGSNNVAFGDGAGHSLTSGTYTVYIGTNAGYYTDSGGYNVALGAGALQANTSGNNSVAIGYLALTASNGAGHNLGIGVGTGSDVTSGTYNTLIGDNTGRGIVTGSYNTIIGNVTGLAAGLSNNIVIADGQGNQRITASSTGAVRFNAYTAATFVAGDKYLVVDSNGNIHVSAVGPAS